MSELTESLFRPNTLVIIRWEDGETLQGTVLSSEDGMIRVAGSDGVTVTVDRDSLSRAVFCYTGFPTVRHKEVPLVVKGNGSIDRYENGRGFVVSNINTRYLLLESSLVDPHLQELARSGSIVGADVLYYVPENQTMIPHVATVIKAGNLDDVLDVISSLARKGKIASAYSFCRLVSDQYGDDSDVNAFFEALTLVQEKSRKLDYYADFPESPRGILEPFGRIIECNENNGYIIDVPSHRKLFFFKAQLLGGLEYKKTKDLIGQPVLYSVMRKESLGDFQARSILPPMSYSQAYDLAEDMHSNPSQIITACDILRLITEQVSNPDYEADLASWGRNKTVQDGLWKFEILPEYSGPAESLFLPVQEVQESLILNRQSTHIRIETDMSGTPEAPIILSRQEYEEWKAAVAVPVANSAPPAEMEEDPEETESLEAVPDMVPVTVQLPSLVNCPDADVYVTSNATITVKYRVGSLFVEGESRPYRFRMGDIIDEELRARAMQLSTKIIQDEPVVCQLSLLEHKATHICTPKTVLEMLSASKEAILTAREKDPSLERDAIYDLYDAAAGFASNVLDKVPDNAVAISLKAIADEALKVFSSSCHKASFNSVKPCGSVYALPKKKAFAVVKDPLFSSTLHFPFSSIVDRSYARGDIREGDELIYAVYPPEKGKSPMIRFVCLARPTAELIGMAEQWELEGRYENAWGIAMNILDAEPDHQDAKLIVKRCEPKVDKTTMKDRQRIFREDLFAQGQIAAAEERYKEAIELFTRILESQDENSFLKSQSIHRILHLYSLLLKKTGGESVKGAYRAAGEQYVLGKNSSPFVLKGDTLDDIDAIIQYYEDMGDTVSLIDAYEVKKRLLQPGAVSDEEERRSAIAQVNANIAWNSLLAGDNSEKPRKYASWAKTEKNDLGRICEAIVLLRLGDGEKEIREKVGFNRQNIDTLEESFAKEYAGKIYSGRSEMKNMVFERFSLLCAIVQEKKRLQGPGRLLHYLGRYLATMTGNEADYHEYFLSTQSVPDDCNFVCQVFKCLQNGAGWDAWTNIRLVCMLSEEAAYKICNTMYDLDVDTAVSVLIHSGLSVYSNPGRPYFGRQFALWRGVGYQNKYISILRKVDAFEKDTDLKKIVDFFRELKFEQWMIQDNYEMINEFHWLPTMLTDFLLADNSRKVKTASRTIVDSVNDWNRRINDRPTVLLECAFARLLFLVRAEVTRIEESHHYTQPILEPRLLTISSLGPEQSMYLEMEIRNKEKNAEPMSDCVLHLKWTEDIIPDSLCPVETFSDTDRVFGDESIMYILHFKLRAGADLSGQKVMLNFEYKVKKEQKNLEFEIPFTPRTEWDDISIDFNLGAPETKRFYGREAYIKNVISVLSDPERTPHFFIYGQKRSGKTSVLLKIQQEVEKKIPSAIMAKIDFLGLEMTREQDIYHIILKRILQVLQKMNIKAMKDPSKDVLDKELLVIPSKAEMTYELLLSKLSELKTALRETRGWEDSRLILFVDEFTSTYKWLIEGLIPKEFMLRWKNLQTEGLLGAVLVGQDVLHSFITATEGPNSFDVLTKKRLNYLEQEEAFRLITEPIEEVTGRKDVFIGNAIRRILYYSASSAYYTKVICTNLIEYMNLRKLSSVTEADIDACVWHKMKTTPPVLLDVQFDPLVFSGITSEKESRFTREETMSVLDIVSDEELRDPMRGCSKASILRRSGAKDDIITDLVERGVLEDYHEYYKIKVKLYTVWYQVRNKY